MPHLVPIPRRRFEAFLRFVGCTMTRQSGDHIVYWRDGLARPVILSKGTEVPLFVVRNNLRVLGISHDEYISILKQL